MLFIFLPCPITSSLLSRNVRAWGGVVVKALRYLSESPGIDSQSCHRGFFLRGIRQFHVPGVKSAS
jgi:hypothetical protein